MCGRPSRLRTPPAADGYRSPIDMLRLTRAVWRDRPDVFWSPSVYTYFPLPPGLPALVTIHDTITERFPELTMPTRRARLFWNAKVRLALSQATLVLTVSEFAAREIEEILGVPRARLRVAGEAAAPTFRPSTMAQARAVARAAGVPDDAPWFTYVGGFTPHKHVDRIVRAHAVLVEEARVAGTARAISRPRRHHEHGQLPRRRRGHPRSDRRLRHGGSCAMDGIPPR